MEHITSLEKEVTTLLSGTLNVQVPSTHEDLLAGGFIDSLKIVELLMELETRFAMRVPLNELEIEVFRSVASIAAFVARQKGSETIQNVLMPASMNDENRFPGAKQ